MSREASPTTGKPYGVQRVCTTCQVPRSTVYAQAQRAATPERPPAKRGPKPAYTDEQLLERIRADLKESPFRGEGHRKVWARLKYGGGVAVSRIPTIPPSCSEGRRPVIPKESALWFRTNPPPCSRRLGA